MNELIAAILDAARSTDWSLAAMSIVSLGLVEIAKATRWRILFGTTRPDFGKCLRALIAGQLTNALSPLRAGEAVRIGLIVTEGAEIVPATAAMAAAKAIDSLCLAAIAFAVFGSAALGNGRWGLIAAIVVLICGVVLALRGTKLRPWLEGNRFARRLRLVGLIDAADTLRSPANLLVVIAATVSVWGFGILANILAFAAVGVAPSVDLASRVIVVGYVIGLLPAPPGRLGVFEAGVVAALTSGGVALATAVTAGVVLHACQLMELLLLLILSLLMRRQWPSASLFRPGMPRRR